MKKKMTLFID